MLLVFECSDLALCLESVLQTKYKQTFVDNYKNGRPSTSVRTTKRELGKMSLRAWRRWWVKWSFLSHSVVTLIYPSVWGDGSFKDVLGLHESSFKVFKYTLAPICLPLHDIPQNSFSSSLFIYGSMWCDFKAICLCGFVSSYWLLLFFVCKSSLLTLSGLTLL